MGNTINETFYFSKSCLYSAIEGGDIDWLKLIFDKNPSYINEGMDDQCTTSPLHRAVWRNDLKIVTYLLDTWKADINLQLQQGHSAVMWAVKRNHIALAKTLLQQYQADPTLTNAQQHDYNILDYAIQFGNYELALYIHQTYSLQPKPVATYQAFRNEYKLKWLNFPVILENLANQVDKHLVPTYNIQPKVEITYEDPVIDPREGWKEYIKRVVEFQDPPLVERNELPSELQPQNSLAGKVRQLVNGQPINKNTQKPVILTQEDNNQMILSHNKEVHIEMKDNQL